jgi:hypothetical protein
MYQYKIRITTIAVLQAVLSVFNGVYCQQSTITMKFEGVNIINIGIGGSTKVTINWGDGSSESKTYDRNDVYYNNEEHLIHGYEHRYSKKTSPTVTVTGNNITYLRCGYNNLTYLDVSKNAALTHLDCEGSRLTDLDVSKNTALTELWCNDNKLTKLNVNKNMALIKLICSNNQLTHLDVGRNNALTHLDCYGNQLTKLDVSRNITLTILWCGANQLTDLDVSKNTALRLLNCRHNQFSADAFNALFETLHGNVIEYKTVSISKNTGTDDCNIKIAQDKGWRFY